MKINYQLKLDEIINKHVENKEVKSLLLHSCCAPCSSYCIEYLSEYFEITLYFYNPNIKSLDEYEKRANELKRLVSMMNTKYKVNVIIADFDTAEFYKIAKGYEDCKEGSERCFRCYELRLRQSCKVAKEKGFDYFTTTLSISPHKNASKLNEIGESLANEYGISYLYSDFKKKNGYKRSIELSKEYDLYRQNYCGCIYSYNASNNTNRNIINE